MSGQFVVFSQNEQAAEVLHRWWRGVNDNRGERAALRRAAELAEVIFLPSYHQLFTELRKIGYVDRLRLAAVAGLLAHVEKDDPSSKFAARMGTASGKEKAALSGLRFRRLLRHGDVQELYPALIRVIRLLDRTANVIDLADSVLAWGDGWRGDRVRQDWAFDYYAEAPREA